jgi:hypothetical protein
MATAYPGGLRKRGGLLDNEDTIQATPRNPFFGGVADLLGQAYKLPEMPRLGVPGMDFMAANRNRLMDLLGVGDVQKTAEALSYGNRLGTGTGMTYRPLPETVGAAMAVAPMVAPAARMAGEGVAATGRFVAPKAGQLAEQYMVNTGGILPLMQLPNGLTRAEQSNLIKSHAEDFAAKAKEMGLSASVEHSGSKAGPSSYVSISDPITGKKFESPFRFSGHSKGPTQNQFVYDVGNDFSKELDLLKSMASSIPRAERDVIQSARQAKMLEELALAEKEKLFSQGRPVVQRAMQEANLQQAPYTKAFSNSGNYLGGLLAP